MFEVSHLNLLEEMSSSCNSVLKTSIEEILEVDKSCPSKHYGLKEDEADFGAILAFDSFKKFLNI